MRKNPAAIPAGKKKFFPVLFSIYLGLHHFKYTTTEKFFKKVLDDVLNV